MRDSLFIDLPDSWEVKKFEDVGETLIGLTYSPKDISDEGILVLRSSNIKGNRLAYTDNVYVKKKVKERLILSSGDILVCVRNGSRRLIGKSALIRGRAVGETFGAFMSVFRSDMPEYMFNVIQSDFIKLQIEQHIGATINQITNASLNSFQFPFPPLSQQKKIAQILSTCDTVLEQTEEAIAKYQALKQGMLHDLFTRGIDIQTGQLRPSYEDAPELYKETELGFVPKEWVVGQFIDFANERVSRSFTGGPFGSDLQTKHYTKEGVRIIQLQNIGDGFFKNKYKIYTSEERANYLLACNIYPGEIILSKMAEPIARACIIPNHSKRYLMASDGIRLSVDEKKFNKRFVLETINQKRFRNIAELRSTGTTRSRIGLTELKEIPVCYPSFKEQNIIGEKLDVLIGKIHAEHQTLAKYEQLKAGLMQDLLSGAVGVEELID